MTDNFYEYYQSTLCEVERFDDALRHHDIESLKTLTLNASKSIIALILPLAMEIGKTDMVELLIKELKTNDGNNNC